MIYAACRSRASADRQTDDATSRDSRRERERERERRTGLSSLLSLSLFRQKCTLSLSLLRVILSRRRLDNTAMWRIPALHSSYNPAALVVPSPECKVSKQSRKSGEPVETLARIPASLYAELRPSHCLHVGRLRSHLTATATSILIEGKKQRYLKRRGRKTRSYCRAAVKHVGKLRH